MDEFMGTGFTSPEPVMRKRRSIATRKPRQEPKSPERSGFRKREFFLNAPPTSTPQSTGGAQLATYRRGSSKNKESPDSHSNSKVPKLKVKVGGVSHTIHQPKGENLRTAEPTRKSIRMNKRRVLDDEENSTRYEKPLADSENRKVKKKRVFKNLPSDDSTDHEAGEEAVAAEVVITDDGPRMEEEKTRNLTSRQKAMLKGGKGSGRVEFPDGLPPAPSRKQKNNTSVEEKLAKKAEAAQRRRLQVEKAAKESQEEAIRKILGLDSDKKKEEKREKEEKVRIAKSQKFNGSAVRWVMSPTGTVVSFPDDVGLPSIFNSEPCRYPPPREKCAGPTCNNTYKYRDSKSKLPLCSLECYRAVQDIA